MPKKYFAITITLMAMGLSVMLFFTWQGANAQLVRDVASGTFMAGVLFALPIFYGWDAEYSET